MADARFHSPQTSHQRRVAILMHHCMKTTVNCQNRVYRYVILHTSRIPSSCVGRVRRVGLVPLSVAAEGSACGATLTVTLSECCVDVRRGTNHSYHHLLFQVFFLVAVVGGWAGSTRVKTCRFQDPRTLQCTDGAAASRGDVHLRRSGWEGK